MQCGGGASLWGITISGDLKYAAIAGGMNQFRSLHPSRGNIGTATQ